MPATFRTMCKLSLYRETEREREGEREGESRQAASYEGQQKPQRIMLNTTMKYLQHVASIPHTHTPRECKEAGGQAGKSCLIKL